MNTQETLNTDPMMSDFYKALMRDKNKNHDSGVSYNSDIASGNRNLSSLLSSIQDDGPAYSEKSNKDNRIQMRTNDSSDVQRRGRQQESTIANDDQYHPSASFRESELTGATMLLENKKSGTWIQLLLVLLVTAVIGLSLYWNDLRTQQLEESLNMFDVRSQEIKASSQSNHLSPQIMDITETLQSVKNEIQVIKTDYVASDNQVEAIIASKLSPQMNDAALMKENVGALKSEIMALRSELQAVKSRLNVIKKDKSFAKKLVVANGWMVNLASLTNKQKIEKVADQLRTVGLTPEIQEAVIKGQHVYRLSVGGFVSRNEAETFVRKASDQFGMKGGWVRRS